MSSGCSLWRMSHCPHSDHGNTDSLYTLRFGQGGPVLSPFLILNSPPTTDITKLLFGHCALVLTGPDFKPNTRIPFLSGLQLILRACMKIFPRLSYIDLPLCIEMYYLPKYKQCYQLLSLYKHTSGSAFGDHVVSGIKPEAPTC